MSSLYHDICCIELSDFVTFENCSSSGDMLEAPFPLKRKKKKTRRWSLNGKCGISSGLKSVTISFKALATRERERE